MYEKIFRIKNVTSPRYRVRYVMHYSYYTHNAIWIKYLGAEEKHSIECDFGDKLYGKIKTSIVWGIVRGYWGSYKS